MSIKSPAMREAYEPSEFMNLKPTKLDLTGDGLEVEKLNDN